jgi:ATP-dependent DNA ligase
MPRPSSRSIQPCLPRFAKQPPTGPDWLHEIKHDGFRILARRDAKGIRLYTRNGYNFADRFPRIVEAIAGLPVQSCFIDGEAIVVDENGLSVFDLIRYRVRSCLISANALRARAAMVRVGGFTPAVGNTIPPTINRFA